MTYPLLELGGQGPLIHLAPANGFPPDTYRPALAPLLPGHRVVSLPPRGFWEDAGPPPSEPGDWGVLADDLLHGLSRHRLPPVIGIGHSFGAVATLIAAVREPERFRALALLDPTIFPPAMMARVREERLRGELSFGSLVQGARKRRDRFESEAEAFEYWRSKPLFADWSDDALLRYTRAMLRPRTEGGFGLAWSPAWEAWYYESFHDGTWDEVERLPRTLPLLIVGGGSSDTFLPEARALLEARLPWARHRSIPGQGHLFPHSAPGVTGRILAEWLGEPNPPTGPGPLPR